jgi:cyclophilin family peptidyl-prolyl cis-trans isomerase
VPSSDKRQRKKDNARQAREARIAAEKRSRRLKSFRNVGIIVALFVVMVLIVNWVQGGDDKKSASTSSTTTPASTTPTTNALQAKCTTTVPKAGKKQSYKSAPPMTVDVNKTYVATMDTSCGSFDITLDPKVAPQTVNSFVFLAKNGFYDGLKFHRVVPDFVVQGGDPDGTGQGGPGYKLPDEPPKNGYKAGSVAMANSGAGTTGSQFFLVLSENGAKGLGGPPYKYSDLGTITKGMDVVTTLGSFGKEGASDPSQQTPTRPLYINKVTVTES